ncbi:hypothetical protein NBE99_03590 [Thermosynechococcus sp. HN-54]|uniref:hypothetical protein n=1 Tax=Thermosynechococcus sp. HN-54 TaxID=2933959 RepID=UPI00202CABD4|nr:hypothetical protein [Thermosynechococcus sp. HN-54]URR36226.1 hypothetical protein NBE99_03590 [Thermosynechococcus sp. HN-54]
MMRQRLSLILFTGAMLTPFVMSVRPLEAQPTITPRNIELTPRHPIIPNLRPPQVLCPDPAVQAVNFSLMNRTTPFEGRVRITGIVRNRGTSTYQSGVNQQMVYLYEQMLGGRARLVAQQPFQNLGVGQEVTVMFERPWNISSPAEGEFPPNYVLEIGYDPDIRIDGNPHNDDCRLGNNRLQRSGAEIRALFR